MRKFKLKKPWKTKKKASFYFYFILFTMIIVMTTSSISSGVSDYLYKKYEIPSFWVIIGLSFFVGLILAIFIGLIIIYPIKNLKNYMNQVAEGNFNVKAKDDSFFDEVDDMYHYFNVMMDEIRATEIIQSDFVNNVSHEFKTPIGAIEGYTTLLSDPNLNEEEKEFYIDKIKNNTERMNLLISNVLLLSKIENQSIETKTTKFSLSEQIRQVIIHLEPKWVEKNVDFNIDLEEIEYIGNEGIMFHLWSNLIGNAIKFGPYNGCIDISLKRIDGRIHFVIKDQGPGINLENRKFIFNKFYQSDTSHKSEGNGLGLSLVKKITDLCHGDISVENINPSGCKFEVILGSVKNLDDKSSL